jgi:predicted dehydrogenase
MRIPSANDRIEIGVIGVGVRGKYLIANLPAEGRVVALCDCALRRIDSALHPSGVFAAPLAEFSQGDGRQCSRWKDYRRMLDQLHLDAVIIAAPDHHHALAMILACQAGCDVYVEKPLALTIAEGRSMVRAAEKFQRIVQVGSQQRSMEMNRVACEFVRSGGLGRISQVDLANYPGPYLRADLPGETLPDDLDWNLFLGPAPDVPPHPRLWVKEEFRLGNLLWRGWDLWRDYSGHLMTNWGAHSVDMVQLALGRDDTGPDSIEVELNSAATAQQTDPDSRLTRYWATKTPQPWHEVGQAAVDFDHRFLPVTMRCADGTRVSFSQQRAATVFLGERGSLTLGRNKFTTDPPGLITELPPPELVRRWQGPGHVARPHLANWLDCVITRSQPNAPLEAAHRTATICHLANIARELGRPLRWDPKHERFVNDPQADERLDRPRRAGFELPRG